MAERASPSRPDWAPTACERLRAFMLAGCWYTSETLERIGGRRFAARLHEIARGADGCPEMAYDCRVVDGCEGIFEYRLREYGPGEDRPKPRRQAARERIEQLARENAELKRRLEQLHAEMRAEGVQHG